MKHLLNGVAIAAVLAISAPAWAQNAPSTTSAPPAAAPAKPAMAMKKPMKKPMMKKAMWHHHHRWAMHSAGDAMTEKLNQEELARIQAGGAGAPMAPAPNRLPGPKASGH